MLIVVPTVVSNRGASHCMHVGTLSNVTLGVTSSAGCPAVPQPHDSSATPTALEALTSTELLLKSASCSLAAHDTDAIAIQPCKRSKV